MQNCYGENFGLDDCPVCCLTAAVEEVVPVSYDEITKVKQLIPMDRGVSWTYLYNNRRAKETVGFTDHSVTVKHLASYRGTDLYKHLSLSVGPNPSAMRRVRYEIVKNVLGVTDLPNVNLLGDRRCGGFYGDYGADFSDFGRVHQILASNQCDFYVGFLAKALTPAEYDWPGFIVQIIRVNEGILCLVTKEHECFLRNSFVMMDHCATPRCYAGDWIFDAPEYNSHIKKKILEMEEYGGRELDDTVVVEEFVFVGVLDAQPLVDTVAPRVLLQPDHSMVQSYSLKTLLVHILNIDSVSVEVLRVQSECRLLLLMSGKLTLLDTAMTEPLMIVLRRMLLCMLKHGKASWFFSGCVCKRDFTELQKRLVYFERVVFPHGALTLEYYVFRLYRVLHSAPFAGLTTYKDVVRLVTSLVVVLNHVQSGDCVISRTIIAMVNALVLDLYSFVTDRKNLTLAGTVGAVFLSESYVGELCGTLALLGFLVDADLYALKTDDGVTVADTVNSMITQDVGMDFLSYFRKNIVPIAVNGNADHLTRFGATDDLRSGYCYLSGFSGLCWRKVLILNRFNPGISAFSIKRLKRFVTVQWFSSSFVAQWKPRGWFGSRVLHIAPIDVDVNEKEYTVTYYRSIDWYLRYVSL
jgi:hypothetical protein